MLNVVKQSPSILCFYKHGSNAAKVSRDPFLYKYLGAWLPSQPLGTELLKEIINSSPFSKSLKHKSWTMLTPLAST